MRESKRSPAVLVCVVLTIVCSFMSFNRASSSANGGVAQDNKAAAPVEVPMGVALPFFGSDDQLPKGFVLLENYTFPSGPPEVKGKKLSLNDRLLVGTSAVADVGKKDLNTNDPEKVKGKAKLPLIDSTTWIGNKYSAFGSLGEPAHTAQVMHHTGNAADDGKPVPLANQIFTTVMREQGTIRLGDGQIKHLPVPKYTDHRPDQQPEVKVDMATEWFPPHLRCRWIIRVQ